MEVRLKTGWIAQDRDGTWKWFPRKPIIEGDTWVGDIRKFKEGDLYPQRMVYIDMPRKEDWTKSLIKV